MRSEDIVERVHQTLSGNPEAFAELVHSHQAMILALARQHTRNWNEAEDIAQETFLRAYRNLGRLRNPATFSRWLCGIALNTARERTRGRAAETGRMEAPLVAAEPRQDPQRAAIDRMISLVGRLPEKLRLPLTLHYVENIPYAEVARILNLDEGATRSRVHRARNILRQWLRRPPA